MTDVDSSPLLRALKSTADSTRLRILALLQSAELTVTDLTQVLMQSQPRVSRHLKLLADADLIQRYKEGAWVFYRLAEDGTLADLGRQLGRLALSDMPLAQRDGDRLNELRRSKLARANAYFAAHASEWDTIRALHAPERDVEAAVRAALGEETIEDLLDVGTGTGRMLELLAPVTRRAVGIDASREMLSVARARLEAEGLSHCHVRLGDMYALPAEDESFDAVLFHQVLHFADDPTAALAEAARTLRADGRMVVVDFAAHDHESLREKFAHQRLGFTEVQLVEWMKAVGVTTDHITHLPGGALTVTLWRGRKQAA
jgi:ubiquinone/menaquinone biosynthesis C-methylase UbiE